MHYFYPNDIHLIYAGGTFGSHGTPLSPLPATTFLPILTNLLNARLDSNQIILNNDCIKDSSSLTPSDFVHFYELIDNAYTQGARRFVLITGTDTLSFLASFLSHAFADTDISLVITGSMSPLLVSDDPHHQINDNSDAWHNLSEAIHTCQTQQGVFVQFYHQTFWASNTQKIDSQSPNAFFGTPAILSQPNFPNLDKQSLSTIKERVATAHIESVFILPNQTHHIAHQLTNISNDTQAVILIAFGSGNLPRSQDIAQALDDLHARGVVVVCTTMCAFGGVSSVYQAGSWQYAHHVWSGGELGIPAIYGRLLWLIVNEKLDKAYWLDNYRLNDDK